MPTYQNINRFSNASARNVLAFATKEAVQEPQMILDSEHQAQSFNYLEPEMIVEQAAQQVNSLELG